MSKLSMFACVVVPLLCFADDPQETSLAPTHMHVVARTRASFSPFTGRVKGNSVRLRLQPDLESTVVKEVGKDTLLSIVGEKDNFWAIQPTADTKAYVFRSFVLDSIVEANRVNVRLEPSLESPIIGHLNAGERAEGAPCAQNSKWLEISTPSSVRFYIAKELVDNVGGPEVRAQFQRKKDAVVSALASAQTLSSTELAKPFDEIDLDRITSAYKSIVQEYAEFPQEVERAKEALAATQEAYLNKRLSYLEAKALTPVAYDEEPLVTNAKEERPARSETGGQITDRMKLWEPIEEALYLTWVNMNEDRDLQEYYEEQRLAAIPISGVVEVYTAGVRHKPGDYILRDNDIPVAYIYSTQINLQELVGKQVTILATPRPNNNFAFPAYFVHSLQ